MLLTASGGPGDPERRTPRTRFYGWPMLAGLSGAEILSWGVLYYSFPVFVQPLEREMGWSRTQVTGAFSLALLVAGLAAVPVGHWIDARGARALMTAGSVLGVLLLALFSTVRSLGALYAIWAGLGLAMAMVLYEPAFALVAVWFARLRDRALTVLTVCGGLASTLLVPLSTLLVARLGWRGTALTLSVLLACTTLPIHALVLRNVPAALGQHPDGDPRAQETLPRPAVPEPLREVLTDPRFWCWTVALTLSSLASVATTVHLIPYLVGRGISAGAAGGALATLGLMQLPGRLAFAPLRRHLALPWAAAAALMAQAIGLAVLMAGTRRSTLAVFVVLFGMGAGTATLLRASAFADLYGLERYGRVGGVVSLCTTLGRAAGPVLASIALAAWGSYRTVLVLLAGALLLAGVVAVVPWALDRPSARLALPGPLSAFAGNASPSRSGSPGPAARGRRSR